MNVRIEYLFNCKEHLATIAGWHQTEFGYLNPSVTLEQRTGRLQESLQTVGLPLTIVAFSDEGKPIGTASVLQKTITHAHLTPWLSTVVVPSEFRGRGVASTLSLHAASEAARLGFKEIHLFTPHNESLYKRLGWKTCERLNHNGLPKIIMSRPT
jgi:predicted N-acetyltransferase YhbS